MAFSDFRALFAVGKKAPTHRILKPFTSPSSGGSLFPVDPIKVRPAEHGQCKAEYFVVLAELLGKTNKTTEV